MPVSLNALFNVPTREEKFTTKRDKELGEQRKEFYSYLDRLEREKEDYGFNRDKLRARSALETGMGVDPTEASRMVDMAASQGLLGNLEKAEKIGGGLPYARTAGRLEGERDVKKAGGEIAKLDDEAIVGAARRPWLADLAGGDMRLQLGNVEVGLKKNENLKKLEDWNNATFDQIMPAKFDAEMAELGVRPVLAEQRTKLGEQAIEAGGLANRLGGVNTRAAEQQEGALQNLMQQYPDFLETPLIQPYEEAKTSIERSGVLRKLLQDPQAAAAILRAVKPGENTSWQGAGTVGAPGVVAKPRLADILDKIELNQ